MQRSPMRKPTLPSRSSSTRSNRSLARSCARNGMTWADVLVGLTLLVAFWGGFRSGGIREMIAILSIIVAWALAGAFASLLSGALQDRFALSPGAGHLAAFWL